MKKRVWIAVLLLAAAAAVICFVLLRPGTKTAGTQILLDGEAPSDPVLSPDSKDLRVILTLDGKEIVNLPFEEAHTVKVIQENGDENSLVLTGDRVYMESANCEGAGLCEDGSGDPGQPGNPGDVRNDHLPAPQAFG